MTNITSIRGDIPEGSGLKNEEIISMIEELLERAKAGEIAAFGYFGVYPSRTVFTGWDGNTRGYNHEMNSAAAIVQYRMMRAHVADE